MLFNVGDYVTRISHNHDLIFRIKEINNDVAILEGINIRLVADASLDDLKKYDEKRIDIDEEDMIFYEKMQDSFDFNRDQYFYLPGKVLHIDTDNLINNNLTNPYKIRKNINFRFNNNLKKTPKNSDFQKMSCTK